MKKVLKWKIKTDIEEETEQQTDIEDRKIKTDRKERCFVWNLIHNNFSFETNVKGIMNKEKAGSFLHLRKCSNNYVF